MWWMNHAHDVLKYERRLSKGVRKQHRSGSDFTPEEEHPEARPFFRINVATDPSMTKDSLLELTVESHELHKEIVLLRKEHEAEEEMNKIMFRRMDAKLNAVFSQTQKLLDGPGDNRLREVIVQKVLRRTEAQNADGTVGSDAGGFSTSTIEVEAGGKGGGRSYGNAIQLSPAGSSVPQNQNRTSRTPSRAALASHTGPATPSSISGIVVDVERRGNADDGQLAAAGEGKLEQLPNNFVADLFQKFDTAQTGSISREQTKALVLQVLTRVGGQNTSAGQLEPVIKELVHSHLDDVVTAKDLAQSLQKWIPEWRTGGLVGLEAFLDSGLPDRAGPVLARSQNAVPASRMHQRAFPANPPRIDISGNSADAQRGIAVARLAKPGSESLTSTPGRCGEEQREKSQGKG